MRQIQSFIILLCGLFAAGVGHAEVTSHTVSLKTGSLLAKEICPTPVWSGVSILLRETKDERGVLEIGRAEKKGKIIDKVFVETSLPQVLEKNIQKILEHCGAKWITGSEGGEWQLSTSIKDFELVTTKKTLKESTKGIGHLILNIVPNGGVANTLHIQFELHYQDARSRSDELRQLERAANDLLVGLLKQIPAQLKTVVP